MGRYLTDLIEERRKLKSDKDFMSLIANAEVDGEQLPDGVLLGFFRQLMNAGGDTSYHGFSNILTALFTNPDQLDAIRRDRSLVTQTIEEGMRWGAPVIVDRIVKEDTVSCRRAHREGRHPACVHASRQSRGSAMAGPP